MFSGGNNPNALSKGIVKEIIFMLLLVSFILLLCALWSHSADDNNWSQDLANSTRINNAMGYIGARVSENMFQWFGKCAYILPFLLLYVGNILLARGSSLLRYNFGSAGVRIVGLNLVIISLCALATKVSFLEGDDFAGGGQVGVIFYDMLHTMMGYNGTILIYIVLLIIGIICSTGWSLTSICGAVGAIVLAVFDFKNSMSYLRDLFRGNADGRNISAEGLYADDGDELSDTDVSFNLVDIELDSPEDSENIEVPKDLVSDGGFAAASAAEKSASAEAYSGSQAFSGEAADFAKPNIAGAADDLIIPGLGTANPEAPRQEVSSVSAPVSEGRVEPTLDLDAVDGFLPQNSVRGNGKPDGAAQAGNSVPGASFASSYPDMAAAAAASVIPEVARSMAGDIPPEYRGASVPPAPPVQNQAQPVQQNTGRFAEYAAPGPSPIKTPERVDSARAGEIRTAQGEPTTLGEPVKYASSYVLPPHGDDKSDSLSEQVGTAGQASENSADSGIDFSAETADDRGLTNFNPDGDQGFTLKNDAAAERFPQKAEASKHAEEDSFGRVEPHFGSFDDTPNRSLGEAVHSASSGYNPYAEEERSAFGGSAEGSDSKTEAFLRAVGEIGASPYMAGNQNFKDREAASGNVIDFAAIQQSNSGNEFGPIPAGFTIVNENESAKSEADSRQASAAQYREQTGFDRDSVQRNADGARFVSHDDLPDAIRYRQGHYEYDESGNLPTFPSTAIFKAPTAQAAVKEADIQAMITRLDNALEQYRIEAHVAEETVVDEYGRSRRVKLYKTGPVVTRFFLDLGTTPLNKIQRVSADLARSLLVPSARVIPTIPGTAYVGIEIPNSDRHTVNMRELLESDAFAKAKGNLVVCLGKDVEGNPVLYDLTKAPHLLVAGTTGSGKSVGINTMLVSLLMKLTPDKLRLIMVDPKILEFSVYRDIPHLLTPIITDMSKVMGVLKWACDEMDHRYMLLERIGVRAIDNYNEIISSNLAKGVVLKDPTWKPSDSMDMEAPALKPLPYILIVIDEFADLIMQKAKQRGELESLVARLAQKARACGIHLILATQSPRKEVITGIIKSNFPSQISFKVKSYMESRIIIDEGGAESLLGRGDMLIKFNDGTNITRRAHGAFISDEEVNAFADAWRARGTPEYVDVINNYGEEEDLSGMSAGAGVASASSSSSDNAMYDSVVEFCGELKRANKNFSVSVIQRHFAIGYNRASRIADRLEENGIISAPIGKTGIREILIDF